MAKTLIDIDDDVLAEVAALLGTTTKKETVDTALRKILDDQRRADALERWIELTEAGAFDEMLDPEWKIKAWRSQST